MRLRVASNKRRNQACKRPGRVLRATRSRMKSGRRHSHRIGAPSRVLVIDPFPVVRLALQGAFSATSDLTVCGEVTTLAGASDAVARLHPNVVLMEIIRPQDFELIRFLRLRQPELPILVYSFRDEDWYAPRCLEAGADGFLTKGVSLQRVIDGLREVLQGRLVLSREIRSRLLARCVPKGCAPLTASRVRRERLFSSASPEETRELAE
jgi:DNA-binding NarL/FixJ family response regulator